MLDPVTNAPIVLLRDEAGNRMLPIWVGVCEANAIAAQVENNTPPRPMTHDLLRQVISDLHGSVERIVITELKEGTFFALIHLRVLGELVLVDSRPSDAIALALRAKAPILVEDVVLEQAKTLDAGAERPDADRLQRWLESLDPEELGKYKM
jgi:bifunctional DNase/RNase